MWLARDDLEGRVNQPIPDEHGQLFTEYAMDRGFSPTKEGIIKTRKIIMHQGSAVDKFDGYGASNSKRRMISLKRVMNGETNPRPDPPPSWSHGIEQGLF
jgi:hypothetical protein